MNVVAIRQTISPEPVAETVMIDTGAQWHRTDLADDMADGDMVGILLGEQNIAIYKVDGTYFATDNICTHAYALLTDGWLDEGIVECPLHGGRFDVTTGEALGDPVTCHLKRFEVRVGASGRLEILA